MTRKALNPITLATIIVIIYTTMPILSVFISVYATTYAYMLLSAFLIVFIVLSGGIRRMSAIIYLTAPLLIYIVLTYAMHGDSILLWGYQNMLFILPVIVGYYFLYYRPENKSIFTGVIVLALLVTAVTTIIGLIRFPFAARTLATIAESDDPEIIKYSWLNIGGYDFVYIVVLLYPILILAHKLKKIKAITFWIAVVLIFTLVVLSEYTTALILITLSSVLYFMGKNLTARQLLLLGISFFILLFFLWPVFSKFLLWVAGLFNSETLNERLTALAGGITGLENAESNRLALYRTSLEGFMSSPVFGRILGAETTNGGHSFILDSLANYGIIGGIVLVISYRNIYKTFFKPFSSEQSYGFVLWAFTQTVILSLVNTGMWLNVIAFFIPVILSVIYELKSEETHENSLDN